MTAATVVPNLDGGTMPAVTTPRPGRAFVGLLPWLFPAAALTLALHHTGTPDRYTALYTAYILAAVTVPGTLTYRALRGSRGNLPEDLGLGTATGLLLLLAGWAAAAATGRQALLPGWPMLILVLFVAVPRLRRCWRIPAEDRDPLPLRWSWIVAAALVVIVIVNYPLWHATPLPPATGSYYPDLMYHLALVHEMMRSMPFQVPQLAGDTLRYHYLSDADMATASMITRIPPAVVLLRLWIAPVEALTVFVVGALTRDLTGKWWAGALGGAASVLALPLAMGTPIDVLGGTQIDEYSPSQAYALPLLGLLVLLAVDVLRGRLLRRAWVMVFPLALACAGAKSSALPPLVAGLILAGLMVAWRARPRLAATIGFLGLTLAGMLLGLRIFAGGGASTLGLQPLAIMYWLPPYKTTLGIQDTIDGTHTLPLGVDNAGASGLIFIAALICWWLIVQSPRLLGLVTLTTTRTRTEPATWLLAGMAMAGTGGAWLLWHPSESQIYFYLCAVPFATALTVRFLAEQTRGWRPVVAGLLAGSLWALVAPTADPPAQNTIGAWTWALALPLLRAAAVAAGLALLALIAWRLATGRYAWRAIPIALVAAVLGAGLAARIGPAVEATAHPPAADHPERAVLADEQRAALWLDAHAGRDDVIATNVHCTVFTWVKGCDARAFWVAGLGGRRTVVESWAYTDQALAAQGVNGLGYVLQPAPYPDRYALNQRLFTKADPADAARLHNQFGVRWIFADNRAQGGASPNLANIATPRYHAGPVTIYELTGPT